MQAQINTEVFEAAHGVKPDGYGNWWFENVGTGDEFPFPGAYEAVTHLLAPGDYKLLP